VTFMESRPTLVDVEGDVEVQARAQDGDGGLSVELLICPCVPAGERGYRLVVPVYAWRQFVRGVSKVLREES